MISGKVWRFGDDIDTDIIIPGRYLDDNSAESLAEHAMEGIDSEFHSKVAEGDIIVAGKHFGIGSSREQAAIALKVAGIKAIIAESFGRIFYRNAINQGIFAIVCPRCSETFETGDYIIINISEGIVESSGRQDKNLRIQPIPPSLMRILEFDGLINMIRSEMQP